MEPDIYRLVSRLCNLYAPALLSADQNDILYFQVDLRTSFEKLVSD